MSADEHDTQAELKKLAAKRMKDLPAETAAGRVDPASLPDRDREELSRRVPHADHDTE